MTGVVPENSIRADSWATVVAHGGTDVLRPDSCGIKRRPKETRCALSRSEFGTLGHDQERPGPHGLAAGTSNEPELRGESVVVVKPTQHRACHELDWAFPSRGKGRPRRAGTAPRYALNSLMGPAFVVVGDVGRHGGVRQVQSGGVGGHPRGPGEDGLLSRRGAGGRD